MSAIGNEKFLSEIRESVKALTEADPYFADIEIISERLKDIDSKLEQTLSIIGGLAIVLVTPTLGKVLANVPGANFEQITIVGRVLENLNLNDTGKEALDVAIYMHALWSQLKPDQLTATLKPLEPSIRLGNDPKYLAYDVAFSTEGGTRIEIPQLAAPDLANDAGEITITHGTPGAAIFRTLNGTPPVPRNPAAQLVQAPFTPGAGVAIRARAWLAGYLPSPEVRLTT